MTYEVVWDGTHRGTDQDLLCCPLRLEKRPAPNTPLRELPDFEARAAAVKRELHTWRTTRELMAICGLSRSAIRSVIAAIDYWHQLERSPLDPGQKKGPRLYRLKQGHS